MKIQVEATQLEQLLRISQNITGAAQTAFAVVLCREDHTISEGEWWMANVLVTLANELQEKLEDLSGISS